MANILAPVCINLTMANGLGIYRGSSWSLPVSVTNKVDGKDEPIDLSGLEGICTIKGSAGDDEAIAMPKVTIMNAEKGEFLVSLSAEDTYSINAEGRTWREVETYQYDVCFTDTASEDVYRTLMGAIEVSPNVTDSDDGK